MTDGMDKLTQKEIKTIKINETTACILKAYLEYSGKVIDSVMNKQGISSHEFKEIDDDLVIKPYELIDLIDQIQRALQEADD
jgi:hypothetical protein